jgi:hypothetical protein
MKAVKFAGIRLINYLNDGINWKDHKDIILDFWVVHKSRNSGYHPNQFKDMHYTDELPLEVQKIYEDWFNNYNFQNENEKEWIKFVDGTLNIFYHTSNPVLMSEDQWYVTLMKSETLAREICETQTFHGNPNINSFWKLDTNTKTEEVGGRRNGSIFSNELELIEPRDTRKYYWGVLFQSPESIKLFYKEKNKTKGKCINWAADCKNMTLLKITPSGRFLVDQVFVEGKAGKDDRNVPQTAVPRTPFTGKTLLKHINRNFYEMYGMWEEIDDIKKDARESTNQRKNATNIMNDEEVKIGRVLRDIDDFIINGNVSRRRRERNKEVRQSIHEKNKLREKEIKKKMREILKEKGKLERRHRNRLNPLLPVKKDLKKIK